MTILSDDHKWHVSDATIQYVTLESSIMLLKDIFSTAHSGYDGTFMILACL
jgi:hypothetical protein